MNPTALANSIVATLKGADYWTGLAALSIAKTLLIHNDTVETHKRDQHRPAPHFEVTE